MGGGLKSLIPKTQREKNGFRISIGRFTMGRANLPPLALYVILEPLQDKGVEVEVEVE